MAQAKVNIPARLAYAETLRHLASGLITVDEHYSSYCRICKFYGEDDAIDAICETVNATVESPFYSGRLRGSHRMTREVRRYVAQCVLLLRVSRSAESCTWPTEKDGRGTSDSVRWSFQFVWGCCFLAPVALGCAGFGRAAAACVAAWFALGLGVAVTHEIRSYLGRRREGEPDVAHGAQFDLLNCWPFPSRCALATARQRPTYLCGVRSVSLA